MRRTVSSLAVVIVLGLVHSGGRAQQANQPAQPNVSGSNEAVGQLHNALETSRVVVEDLRTRVLEDPSDRDRARQYLQAHIVLLEALTRMHTEFIQKAAEEGEFYNALRNLQKQQEEQIAETKVQIDVFKREGKPDKAIQLLDLFGQGEHWLKQLEDARGVLSEQLKWAKVRREELQDSLRVAQLYLAQRHIYDKSLDEMSKIMTDFAGFRTVPPPLLALKPPVKNHTLTPPPPGGLVP